MTKTEQKEKPIVKTDGQRYLLTILAKEDGALAKLEDLLKSLDIVVEKSENLGRRPLTFPIKKNHELLLMSCYFTIDPTLAPKLDKKLAHEEYITRFLLTTWNAEIADYNERGGKRVRKDV